jgi:hypothetical protein
MYAALALQEDVSQQTLRVDVALIETVIAISNGIALPGLRCHPFP